MGRIPSLLSYKYILNQKQCSCESDRFTWRSASRSSSPEARMAWPAWGCATWWLPVCYHPCRCKWDSAKRWTFYGWELEPGFVPVPAVHLPPRFLGRRARGIGPEYCSVASRSCSVAVEAAADDAADARHCFRVRKLAWRIGCRKPVDATLANCPEYPRARPTALPAAIGSLSSADLEIV